MPGERDGMVSTHAVSLEPKRMEWIQPVDFAAYYLAWTEINTFF